MTDTDKLKEQTDNRFVKMNDRMVEVERQLDTVSIILDKPEMPSHDKLFEALAKAQAELTDPEQTGEAEVRMKSGGKYGYKYATLSGVLSTVRPILAKNGLSLMQLPTRANSDKGGEMLGLTTIIGHKSGQSIENYFEMLVPDPTPQGVGSAMTYMRRYAAMSILAIAGANDDDAEKTNPKEKSISADQADQIFNLADELFGSDSEDLLKRMCDKIFDVPKVTDIPAHEFDVAMRKIQNTRDRKDREAAAEKKPEPKEEEPKEEKPKDKKPSKPSMTPDN